MAASEDGQLDTPQLRYAQQLPYCRGAKRLRGTQYLPYNRGGWSKTRRGVKVTGMLAAADQDGQFDTPQLRYAQQLPYYRGAKRLRGTQCLPYNRGGGSKTRRGVKVVGMLAAADQDGQLDTPQLRYAQQLPYCRGAKRLRGTPIPPLQ